MSSPWMPLYVGDYTGRHLASDRTLEHGAYSAADHALLAARMRFRRMTGSSPIMHA